MSDIAFAAAAGVPEKGRRSTPDGIALMDTLGDLVDRPEELGVSPQRFINRELSWLEFNRRVLQEASNRNHPLLEQLRFLSISANNLDEFFMVRVAGPARAGPPGRRDRVGGRAFAGRAARKGARGRLGAGGRAAAALARAARRDRQGRHRAGDPADLGKSDVAWLETHFLSHIFPVLTPLAVDPAHPFPFIPNFGFSIALELVRPGDSKVLRALIRLPQKSERFVHLPHVEARRRVSSRWRRWSGCSRSRCSPATCSRLGRLSRDPRLRSRDRGGGGGPRPPVRIGLEAATSRLRDPARVRQPDAAGAPCLRRRGDRRRRRRDLRAGRNAGPERIVRDRRTRQARAEVQALQPALSRARARQRRRLLLAIRQKDLVVHHPYESFDVVVQYLKQAARDPNVVAIKQTLYRTSSDSPIVGALIEAAEAGKSVTALVELKARFDEEANIRWVARPRAGRSPGGVGFIELKTHGKLSMVVRREGANLITYCHIGTGNYHPTTAKIYTDVSFFTADPAIGRDVSRVFNFITGYAEPGDLERLAMSPVSLRERFLQERRGGGRLRQSRQEGLDLVEVQLAGGSRHHRFALQGEPGRRADRVRGARHLLPPSRRAGPLRQHPGEVDHRTLPRACPHLLLRQRPRPAAPKALVYVSSADLMTRKPRPTRGDHAAGADPTVHEQVLDQIMVANLLDNQQSYLVSPDGSSTRIVAPANEEPFNAHSYFMTNSSLSGRGKSLKESSPRTLFKRLENR